MIIVADNLHIIHPTIAQAVEAFDPGPITDWVLRCVAAGAQAIDINSGPLVKDPQRRMAFLVETVRAATQLPIFLDTTNPVALRAGLEACQGAAAINGFSLEPAKVEKILPLAQAFDADIVGYLLQPDCRMPVDEDEMMALAVALFDTFSKTGLSPQRLIIDPVIAPLSWQEGVRHNQSVLALLRTLPDLLGVPVRTIAGLSNLASGAMPLERKIALEQAFLPMLAASGLDMVLVNVLHGPTMEIIKTSNALLSETIFSWG